MTPWQSMFYEYISWNEIIYDTVFGQMSHKPRTHAKRRYSFHVYPIKGSGRHEKGLLHPQSFKHIDQAAYRKYYIYYVKIVDLYMSPVQNPGLVAKI